MDEQFFSFLVIVSVVWGILGLKWITTLIDDDEPTYLGWFIAGPFVWIGLLAMGICDTYIKLSKIVKAKIKVRWPTGLRYILGLVRKQTKEQDKQEVKSEFLHKGNRNHDTWIPHNRAIYRF